MHRSPARWTRALTAAALLTLPASAFAQAQPPATPPPATQAQPEPQPPSQPQDTKVDAAAAKQQLSDARDTLSQLTSMPEAAKLTGDARTQVSTLISDFNELITTETDWRAAYKKVDAGLTTLLGPDTPGATPPASGVSGAVGTSGASGATLDPAVRAKLVEFRTRLKEFERAAGGNAAAAVAPGVTTTPNPADPATTPANPAMAPAADQVKAAEPVAKTEVTRHLDAISAILDQSKTGTLTKTQTTELKKHVDELRALLAK